MKESELYDIFHQDKKDISFYLKIAEKYSNGSILEVGSGTGRILLSLAKKGFCVDGLEPDNERAESCEKKIFELSDEIRTKVCLIKKLSDDYETSKKYSLIILPFRLIQLMGNHKSIEKSLAHLKNMLTPDGVLVFDALYPSVEILQKFEAEKGRPLYVKELKDEVEKIYKTSFIIHEIDTLAQTFRAERAYEFLNEQGECQKVSHNWNSTYITRYEAEYLMKYLGFEVIDIYGDFDMNDLEGHANPKNMVFVLKNNL